MILIGIGANLSNENYPSPLSACEAAVETLKRESGVKILCQSPWYKSEPVPASEQPWYVNGVASLETKLGAKALLALLHKTEEKLGRVRSYKNAPRVIDLDLLAYNEEIHANEALRVPHPRLHLRSFVLLPLQEVDPAWRHPENNDSIAEMIKKMPKGQVCLPLND